MSGLTTTCSCAAASSTSGPDSEGAPRESTAPSMRGGSPRVQRWASRRSAPAYSTTCPPPTSRLRSSRSAPPSPTAEARPEATAASAVPAGAVTSTSQAVARPRGSEIGPSGSTTVSRICIAVSDPFRAGTRDGEDETARSPPQTSPTAHGHVGQYWRHPRTCHGQHARRPPPSDLDWSALPPKVPDQWPLVDHLRSVTSVSGTAYVRIDNRVRPYPEPPTSVPGNQPPTGERLSIERTRVPVRTRGHGHRQAAHSKSEQVTAIQAGRVRKTTARYRGRPHYSGSERPRDSRA